MTNALAFLRQKANPTRDIKRLRIEKLSAYMQETDFGLTPNVKSQETLRVPVPGCPAIAKNMSNTCESETR